MSYCLLGIFGVNLPLLYGEGEGRAFLRLQEAILKVSEDYTIFVWSTQPSELSFSAPRQHHGLLADSVRRFDGGLQVSDGHSADLHFPQNVATFQYSDLSRSYFAGLPNEPPVLTSRGLRITLWTHKINSLEIAPETTLYVKIYCRLQVSCQGSGTFRTLFLRLRLVPGDAYNTEVYYREGLVSSSKDVLISDSLENAAFVRSTIYVGQKYRQNLDMNTFFSRLMLARCAIEMELEGVHLLGSTPELSIYGTLAVVLGQHDTNCAAVLLVRNGVDHAIVCTGLRGGRPWCIVEFAKSDAQSSLAQLMQLLTFQVDNDPLRFSRDRGCVVFAKDVGIAAVIKRRPRRLASSEVRASFLLTINAMDKDSIAKSWKFGGAQDRLIE
jgi:hypothetical protein